MTIPATALFFFRSFLLCHARPIKMVKYQQETSLVSCLLARARRPFFSRHSCQALAGHQSLKTTPVFSLARAFRELFFYFFFFSL